MITACSPIYFMNRGHDCSLISAQGTSDILRVLHNRLSWKSVDQNWKVILVEVTLSRQESFRILPEPVEKQPKITIPTNVEKDQIIYVLVATFKNPN